MLQKIWYQLVKIYISIGLFFYHKKIQIVGREHIPRKGALLFVSNHKNALIDPLLIATTTTRDIHFLTRASAFKIKLVKWILSTVNMLPIYRIRDGKESLSKNEEIFNTCYNLLNKKRSLLIFPEGTHDIRRWVRPLSKGFTRITFGALEQNPNLELTIIPVGLNYNRAEAFAEAVSIYYGAPLQVKDFVNNPLTNADALKLREEVRFRMKALTTHIEPIEDAEAILEKTGIDDFLDPIAVNHKIQNASVDTNISRSQKSKPPLVWRIGYLLVKLNSLFVVLIWQLVKPKIQEVEFESTTRFAVGITGIPLFYCLQALAIYHFFDLKTALIYLVISILFFGLIAKSK